MWVYICRPIGDVAQLVEQRIENPCVGGSIPSITTQKPFGTPRGFFLYLKIAFWNTQEVPVGTKVVTT